MRCGEAGIPCKRTKMARWRRVKGWRVSERTLRFLELIGELDRRFAASGFDRTAKKNQRKGDHGRSRYRGLCRGSSRRRL
jgi:hypothetical protein